MNKQTNELKEWQFNKDYFDNLSDDEFNALKMDVKEHGISNDLHILKDGTVICGHQRLRVAKELGLSEVPVKIIPLEDEREIKMYAIKDNILRRQLTPEKKAKPVSMYIMMKEEIGKEKLGINQYTTKEEVDKLSTPLGIKSRDIIAKELGLGSGRTMDRLIQYAKIVEAKPELKGTKITVAIKKDTTEKKKEAIKQEVKDDKTENIIQGNALTELKKIKDNTVGLCIIDPPYGINFKSVRGKGTNDFDDSISLTEFEDIVIEIKRVLTKDAHFYCFIGFQTYGEYKAIIERHFEFRNCLIWVKNNHTPTNYDNNYAHKYEMIIFATKGARPLNNKLSVDILEYDNIQGKQHNSEKPVDLLEYLIKNSSSENEVVLDCFAGSGSTLVASEKLNRSWIGIELQEEFCNLIKHRIREVRNERQTN